MTAIQQASHVLPMRVIVADDDPIFRSLVRAQLGTRADEIVEAADGLEAWSHILSLNFQLALIDLSMPNLDGIALIQCIRGHPRTRHLPIIVITSRDDKDAVDKALAAGATSFLTKPVNSGHVRPPHRLSVEAEPRCSSGA